MAEVVFRNKRVLVTGANGFIGSHIVNRMAGYGCEVHAFVRESSDLWRLDEVRDSLNLAYIDLRDGAEVFKQVARIKPDYIFHMAAYGVDSRQKDYVKAAETNIIGTINLVSAAAAIGCEKFLNAGTSMQYGNKNKAIAENDTYSPSNIYGSTKAASTLTAHQIAMENKLDIVTLIPFGVFGEKEGSHKFFPHVILSALGDRDIKLSPCDQFRDYCYIDNIVDGFTAAALEGSLENEIFNIGSGASYPLRHYVDLIMIRIESAGKVLYGAVGHRENDLWNPRPDISKISTVLGWKPKVSLEDGIEKTIGWFRQNFSKYSERGR